MYVKDSVTNVPIAKPLCDDFIRGGPERARNNTYLTNFPAKNIGLVVATKLNGDPNVREDKAKCISPFSSNLVCDVANS